MSNHKSKLTHVCTQISTHMSKHMCDHKSKRISTHKYTAVTLGRHGLAAAMRVLVRACVRGTLVAGMAFVPRILLSESQVPIKYVTRVLCTY